MGSVIEHFDLHFATLSGRLVIVKLPHSPLFFLNGSKYTCSCYEAEHPPPATVEYSTKGTNANFKIRGNQEIVESTMHSLGQGIADGFTRGRQRYNALSEE